MSYTFLDLAKERYSVRKFTDQPVEQEKLDMILEAGNVAVCIWIKTRIGRTLNSRAFIPAR